MLLFRWLVLLMLFGSLASFTLYAGTQDVRFKRYGWLILKWAVLFALGFFAVLILERMG